MESSSAQETYNLSVAKIQSDISAAKKNIETLKKELSEYEALEETYSDDNKKYTEYDETGPTVNTKIRTKALKIHMRDTKKRLRNMKKSLKMLRGIITITLKALKTSTMNW